MNIAEKVTRTLEFHQKGQIDEALEFGGIFGSHSKT